MQIRAEIANCGDMHFIFRIVDEGAKEHAMLPGKVFQQVVGTHLVALVWRVGEAMDEVEGMFAIFRSAEIADDMWSQPVGQANGHASPGLDEEAIFGICRIVREMLSLL